jgi:membrane associated rhomboid family serine protease
VDRANADATPEARARGTVAIHEAASEDVAREVASRLLVAGVPAAVEVLRADAAWVIVASDRHNDADVLLRRWGLTVLPRFGADGDFELAALRRERPQLSVLADATTLRPSAHALEADDDDSPIDTPLPESGPLVPRLVVALAAIGFGIGVQRALESALGPGGAAAAMAARGLALDELWRLVTAGFFHFSLAHLASNLAFGLMFGVVLFGTHGVGAAMAAWLVASVVGIGTEAAVSSGVLVAGASAGNYGLAGLWAKGQLDRGRRAFLPRVDRLKALGIVLVLAPGALTPVTQSGARVAVLAHAMGFLAGAMMGIVFERRVVPRELAALDRRARWGQWLSLVAVALAFAAGLASWLRLVTSP